MGVSVVMSSFGLWVDVVDGFTVPASNLQLRAVNI